MDTITNTFKSVVLWVACALVVWLAIKFASVILSALALLMSLVASVMLPAALVIAIVSAVAFTGFGMSLR